MVNKIREIAYRIIWSCCRRGVLTILRVFTALKSDKIGNFPIISVNMKRAKKIAVILPVLVVSCVYAYLNHLQQFQHASGKRLLALVVSVLLFYIWAAVGIKKRRQDSFFDMLVQSSFYVYIFSVLTLTGYFVLFNQVSLHDWWHKIIRRIDTRDGVNFTAFVFMRARHVLNYGVVGNFAMLLPLGIYLPLLYRNLKNLVTVTFTAMLVSVSIELMQLASNVRITDIDDVILNTAGAATGFIIYYIAWSFVPKPSPAPQPYRVSR